MLPKWTQMQAFWKELLILDYFRHTSQNSNTPQRTSPWNYLHASLIIKELTVTIVNLDFAVCQLRILLWVTIWATQMNIFFYCFKKMSEYFLWVSPRTWQKWLHFLCSSWGALGTVWYLLWLCGPSRHIKARTAIARSCCCVLLIFPVYRNFLIGQVWFDLLPILRFKIAAKQY